MTDSYRILVAAVHAVENSIEENLPFAVGFINIRLFPGRDGLWAARRIRALDPNIGIVLMSGFHDYSLEKIITQIPSVEKLFYLEKPFQIREIFYFTTILCSKWQKECRLLCRVNESEEKVEAQTRNLEKKEPAFK